MKNWVNKTSVMWIPKWLTCTNTPSEERKTWWIHLWNSNSTTQTCIIYGLQNMTNFTWFRCYFQHKYIDFVVSVYGSVLFRDLVCVIHLIRRILHIKKVGCYKINVSCELPLFFYQSLYLGVDFSQQRRE